MHTAKRQDRVVHPISNLVDRNIVHVKFYMANVAKSLDGIRSLDERGWVDGGRPALTPNGRQVLTNAQMLGISRLWAQLVGQGFQLYDAYREPWKTEGLVITVVFCRPTVMEDGGELKLPDNALLPLNELFGKTWQYGHVWENPDQSMSVMVIGPRNETEPSSTLEAKEGFLQQFELNRAERRPNRS